MNVVALGDGYYRAYGEVSSFSASITQYIHYSDGSWFEILAYRVSVFPFVTNSLSYYGHVYDYSYSPTKATDFSGVGSSPMTPISISPNASREDFKGFVSRIYLSSWNAYDYISLNIALFRLALLLLRLNWTVS